MPDHWQHLNLPDSLEIKVEQDILLIGLNRPAKRNAINDELLLGIERIFDLIPGDIRVIILYGQGKHFSAGLDLAELQERNAVAGIQHSRMWHRVVDKIQFGPAPVIAVLHGAVVGGGLELAAACHIRVAAPDTFFALPEGQRGIFVGGGAAVRVPKLIGLARMTDMMLTGRVYRAEEAERIGLVQYLAEEGASMDTARELAGKIAGNAPMTNYALTHVLPRIVDAGQDQALVMESLMAAIAQDAPEAKQRLRDFLEGRAKKVGE
ncbi:crotonase/enoyl-CoA hydratase family protein [Flavilitoribacter nigricans]|uniref:Enoyl-CoA hydratase n=1 Tax=Flavilitoribacter nigricans (strain ATCC 23147 / DSM 23189 / NBRC 102662 / NCIMB 1420 / SS-2) TaxID=1122177 RepID=A0A2D0N037_FLAN2|nr:crotonase/enoyl-CoA hydratase family protein [Flavilitoribacter nigricans]PHN01912.1 enoyl-CoA hydratase [Flavilitoribacter nigricans DSM 23189 = NBRC 102662]